MDIKLREDILRFLQKIVNGIPDEPTSIRHYQSDAYLLEMELRQEIKPEESIIDCPNDSIAKMLTRFTPKQREHYSSIKWLFGEGPRREGRTFLMAVFFIEKSFTKHRWVRIFDHSCVSFSGTKEILSSIRFIVGNIPELELEIRTSSCSTEILVRKLGIKKLIHSNDPWGATKINFDYSKDK